ATFRRRSRFSARSRAEFFEACGTRFAFRFGRLALSAAVEKFVDRFGAVVRFSSVNGARFLRLVLAAKRRNGIRTVRRTRALLIRKPRIPMGKVVDQFERKFIKELRRFRRQIFA